MEIVLDPHTLERAQERGTTEEEIRDVIDTGVEISGKYGRLGKSKIYPFDRTRRGQTLRAEESGSVLHRRS